MLQLAGDDHFEYSAALIRGLNFMMCDNDLGASPGKWRPGQVFVRNDTTRDVVYEGPDPAHVPDAGAGAPGVALGRWLHEQQRGALDLLV